MLSIDTVVAHARKRISLVLLDDNPLPREGVVALIRANRGFRVLAASSEIKGALRKVRQTRPDLVLLNLRRQDDDSLTLAGALHGEAPESRVILMGLEPLHENVAGFVRAGVSGFIMADASFDRFLSTILSVARGIQVLPWQLTRSLFGQLSGHGVQGGPKRKPAVQGLSNKEITARLRILESP